jgi:hypothetical protein
MVGFWLVGLRAKVERGEDPELLSDRLRKERFVQVLTKQRTPNTSYL